MVKLLKIFFSRSEKVLGLNHGIQTGDQEVAGSTPAEVGNILSWRLIVIFSTVILSLPLIQEGQLSVSGERMCTILVNRLED